MAYLSLCICFKVVDLPIIKEDNVEADGSNKATKRKKITSSSTNLAMTSRKHLAQKLQQLPLSKSKIAAKDQKQLQTSTSAGDETNSINDQQEKIEDNKQKISEAKELDTEEGAWRSDSPFSLKIQ